MTASQPATPGSDSPTPGMETHRMLAGSHEQPGGAECRCGAPWDRWNDTCTQAAAPSPVDTPEPPAEALRDDDHEPYANAYEWEPVAARPPADTETLRADPIEAVAVALWNAEHSFPWSLSITQDYYRSRARAALDAR